MQKSDAGRSGRVPGSRQHSAPRARVADASVDRTAWPRMLDTSVNLNVARAAGTVYGLKKTRVAEVIRDVGDAVATWRDEADDLGISRREQEMMSRAFLPSGD